MYIILYFTLMLCFIFSGLEDIVIITLIKLRACLEFCVNDYFYKVVTQLDILRYWLLHMHVNHTLYLSTSAQKCWGWLILQPGLRFLNFSKKLWHGSILQATRGAAFISHMACMFSIPFTSLPVTKIYFWFLFLIFWNVFVWNFLQILFLNGIHYIFFQLHKIKCFLLFLTNWLIMKQLFLWLYTVSV